MSDMERDRLISQHGPYSQAVATYDANASAKRERQSFEDTMDGLGSGPERPTLPSASQPGDATHFWLLVLIVAAGAVAWRLTLYILAEYRAGWSALQVAVFHPTSGASLLLFAALVLSLAATFLVAGRLRSIRRLRRWARITTPVIATIPAMAALSLLGWAVAQVPGVGAWTAGAVAELVRSSSRPWPMSVPSVLPSLLLGASAVIVCLPALILASRVIGRTASVVTRLAASARAFLAARGLSVPAAMAVVSLLAALLVGIPIPGLSAPYDIWPQVPILLGILFGWQIVLPSLALVVVVLMPGLADHSLIALPRLNTMLLLLPWWVLMVACGTFAGLLRSAEPATLGRELATAFAAAALAVVAGSVTWGMIGLLRGDATVAVDALVAFWTRAVPPALSSLAGGAAIAGVAAAIIRPAWWSLATVTQRRA